MDNAVERYRTEAKYIHNAALEAAERHYAAETPWYYSIYYLGIPSTVLSAVAGAAAFSKLEDSEFVAGVISISVAILTSLMTFLDPTKKASLHHSLAKSYEALYHEVGYFIRIELLEADVPPEGSLVRLKALSTKFNDLNVTSPPIPVRAYRVAERKLEAGRGEVVRDPGDAATSTPVSHDA